MIIFLAWLSGIFALLSVAGVALLHVTGYGEVALHPLKRMVTTATVLAIIAIGLITFWQ